MTPADLDVLVLCGGRGARLGALTATTPKPLLPVGGCPFLLRLLRQLRAEGFSRFFLAASYHHEQVAAFLEAHRQDLPDTRLIVEPEPLGTGGALRHALAWVQSPTFVAVNGDSWVSQPLAPVLAQHWEFGRTFTAVAVQVGRVQGLALNKGVWKIGTDGTFQGFETASLVETGWVNAGVYIVDRAAATGWLQGRYSLEDAFPRLLAHQRAGVFCSPGTLVDIGTPECYAWADQALRTTDALIPPVTGVARHG